MPPNYTDSSGKTTPINELSSYHLLNALLKLEREIAINEAGLAMEEEKKMHSALKVECIRRMSY